MPSSSSSSRRKASRGCSPSSILPPGNSHFSGMVWWRVRWQTRSFPFSTIRAATTRFTEQSPRFSRSCRSLFQLAADQLSAELHEFLMFCGKGGREMTVDVEFSNDPASDEDGNDNFRFRFQRAGQIPRVFIHVVDNY